jgi:hypothetical protein
MRIAKGVYSKFRRAQDVQAILCRRGHQKAAARQDCDRDGACNELRLGDERPMGPLLLTIEVLSFLAIFESFLQLLNS